MSAAAPKRDQKKGRTPKLTTAVIASMETFIEQGLTWKDAALLSGTTDNTVHKWRQRGNEDIEAGKENTRYAQFVQRLALAEARLMQKASLAVVVASKDSWQAAAWLLQRRRPEEYGQKVKSEVTGEDGGPIPVQAVPVTVNLNVKSSETIEFTEGQPEEEDEDDIPPEPESPATDVDGE